MPKTQNGLLVCTMITIIPYFLIMNFIHLAICNEGKSLPTCQKTFSISTREESTLRQHLTKMEAKISASIEGIKNEMNEIKTEQDAMKKTIRTIEPDMANTEERILASVTSVADAVKREKDQLDEIKSRLGAIEEITNLETTSNERMAKSELNAAEKMNMAGIERIKAVLETLNEGHKLSEAMSNDNLIGEYRYNGGLTSVMERLYASLKDMDIKVTNMETTSNERIAKSEVNAAEKMNMAGIERIKAVLEALNEGHKLDEAMSKTNLISRSRRNGGLNSVMERLYTSLKDLDIKT